MSKDYFFCWMTVILNSSKSLEIRKYANTDIKIHTDPHFLGETFDTLNK